MNVSLAFVQPPTAVTDQIQASAAVLSVYDDTHPIGPPVLVPENQVEYPGSYQVWYPTDNGWVFVNTEGVVVHTEQLPDADDMRSR